MQNPPSGSASATPDPDPGSDPGSGRPPRWGLGDVIAGFFAAELLSLLFGAAVLSGSTYAINPGPSVGAAFGQVVGHLATGTPPAYDGPLPIPLWLTAVIQIPLWIGLLGVPIIATVTKGNGPVRDLGLRVRAIDVPVGLAIGVAAQLVLVPLLYVPIFWLFGEQDVSAAARQLTDRATDPFGVVMLFLIVGIGAPIAEEIFFRGLTQRSLTRRWGAWVALFGTAAFFAATHFELLQLPALFVFGLVLGAMVMVTGRLGTSIWAHLGFNMVAAATLVWEISPPLWALALIGLLGLVAGGYLVVVWVSSAESRRG
ncbi:MAG: CPBP family intramembrane glutamic endopeptidase [Acidimicrobiales bacterium]